MRMICKRPILEVDFNLNVIKGRMTRILFIIIANLIALSCAKANDGVFRINGNELVPIHNTDIKVSKEILSIKKISEKQVAVSVYYEFDNPGEGQLINVGFEARPPQEDEEPLADDTFKKVPANAPHPFMHNFTVSMNGNILPFTNKVEYNQKYGSTKMYVYLFNADFVTGKNIIRHSYICDFSENVSSFYEFSYVLDAAKRWTGGKIGDFTLIVDMGDFASLAIPETFFDNISDWTMVGNGKIIDFKKSMKDKEDYSPDSLMKCYIRQGMIVFHKTDFVPMSNLNIFCLDGICTITTENINNDLFDARKYKDEFFCHIPFTDVKPKMKAKDEYSARVLRNIPFARRGYIFKDQSLQKFFEAMEWYMPDPNYRP